MKRPRTRIVLLLTVFALLVYGLSVPSTTTWSTTLQEHRLL